MRGATWLRRFGGVLLLASATAAAQDYAREKRWETEVVGNLVVGEAVRLRVPSGREFLGLYTPAGNARTAVVIVHGIGVHPDHGIIGILRGALADRGYTTLSVQMPVMASDANVADYGMPVFAEAVERIAAAGRWLRERGPADIALVAHSLGASMSEAYWKAEGDAVYSCGVFLGLSSELSGFPLLRVPVLDVYGEFDNPRARGAAPARSRVLAAIAGSRQVMIPGADHFYEGRDPQLTDAIVTFLAGRGGSSR